MTNVPSRRVGCTSAGRKHRRGTNGLRRKSEAGPGGHAGRPYEGTGSGSVGADCISALGQVRFPTNLRRIGRAAGTEDSAVGKLPCTRRLAGRCGHRPLRREPTDSGENRNLVPGGHAGRPYAPSPNASTARLFPIFSPCERDSRPPGWRIFSRAGRIKPPTPKEGVRWKQKQWGPFSPHCARPPG